MPRPARTSPWVAIVTAIVAALVLLAFGFGLLPPPEGMERPEEEPAPGPPRVEEAEEAPAPADPTLAGRAPEGSRAVDERALAEDEPAVRVVLERAATIRGRLVTADGRPIPRAFVMVRRGEERVGYAATEEDGTFVAKLQDGSPVDLVFNGQIAGGGESPFRHLIARLENVRIGSRDVELIASEAPADRFVDVLVLDPEGRGVEGVSVFAAGPRVAQQTTDAAGRCRLEGLRAASTPVFAGVQWSEARPWISPGSTTLLPGGQEVVIRLLAARLLQGTLEAPEGTPPATQILVRVLRSDGSQIARLTGSLQRAVLWLPVSAEEDGPFTLVVEPSGSGPGLEGRLEGVRPGSRNLRLVLRHRP